MTSCSDTVVSVARILDDSTRLPSLPIIIAELNEEIASPNCDGESVAAIISKDQALTSVILKMANSAFYGFPRQVDTLSEAVAFVGLHQVRTLAFAAPVVKLFDEIGDDLLRPADFWEHSIATALFSREIARRSESENPEKLFICGLLHDIGRLVLATFFPEKLSEVLRLAADEDRPVRELEQEAFGVTHELIGQALAEHWSLPHTFGHIIRWHHEPSQSRELLDETAIVHLADVAAQALDIGASGEPVMEAPDTVALDALQMVPEELQQAIETITPAIGEITKLLGGR